MPGMKLQSRAVLAFLLSFFVVFTVYWKISTFFLSLLFLSSRRVGRQSETPPLAVEQPIT